MFRVRLRTRAEIDFYLVPFICGAVKFFDTVAQNSRAAAVQPNNSERELKLSDCLPSSIAKCHTYNIFCVVGDADGACKNVSMCACLLSRRTAAFSS